jgi:hypothetical protein
MKIWKVILQYSTVKESSNTTTTLSVPKFISQLTFAVSIVQLWAPISIITYRYMLTVMFFYWLVATSLPWAHDNIYVASFYIYAYWISERIESVLSKYCIHVPFIFRWTFCLAENCRGGPDSKFYQKRTICTRVKKGMYKRGLAQGVAQINYRVCS